MLRIVRNRLIGRLLLAIYALSAIAAGSFHDHGHGHGQGHGHPHGSSCQHADDQVAGVGHEHQDHDDCGLTENSVQNSEQSSDDAVCVVCRFLGLSSLPIALPPLPATAELVATVNPVEPRHAALPLALTLHSRAPPQGV
jgi:hypothetical protein